MHYQTILITLFATTAFCKNPWVSSYYDADCSGTGAGDSVSIDVDDCVPFDSTYNAVKVNFGTELEEITSLSVFSDANCMTPAGPDITASMAYGTPAQCINQSQHGAKWGSVRKTLPN